MRFPSQRGKNWTQSQAWTALRGHAHGNEMVELLGGDKTPLRQLIVNHFSGKNHFGYFVVWPLGRYLAPRSILLPPASHHVVDGHLSAPVDTFAPVVHGFVHIDALPVYDEFTSVLFCAIRGWTARGRRFVGSLENDMVFPVSFRLSFSLSKKSRIRMLFKYKNVFMLL